MWALGCASAAIVADLILTIVMHYRGDSNFAALLFLGTVISAILLGAAGLVLGILGRALLD